jgi:hypothetical protein
MNEADHLVRMQQHRDAWRAYAYGKGPKPKDYLDGNCVDRPETLIEKLEALVNRRFCND